MARYRTTIESSLTPEATIARLADFSSAQRWDPSVVEARRLDDGELGIGSRFHLVVSFLGRRVPLEYRIVSFVPVNHIALRAENATIVSHDTITVEPTESGCVVTYDADLQLKGALRILDPLLGLVFGRIGDRARDGLRHELLSPVGPRP